MSVGEAEAPQKARGDGNIHQRRQEYSSIFIVAARFCFGLSFSFLFSRVFYYYYYYIILLLLLYRGIYKGDNGVRDSGEALIIANRAMLLQDSVQTKN